MNHLHRKSKNMNSFNSFLSYIDSENIRKINWSNLLRLYQVKKCPLCKNEFSGYLKRRPGEICSIELSPEFCVHYSQTHGVPTYYLMLEISEMIFNDERLKQDFVRRYAFLSHA